MATNEPTSENVSLNKDEDFLVVGLGASAGGIQALKTFFTRIPKDSGMAYVVILHMSPEHESKLPEILQLVSAIPVTQVKTRVKVVPNHVYVIPPNQNLSMTDGHLNPTTFIGAEERRSPVDLFFRTLAETNDSRAVSVILSGTGANGSIGLKRIKENGGVAFVQDPNEAEYKDMPRNAIATGRVDYILPVAEIPAKLISFNEHRNTIQIPEVPKDFPPTDEQALREVFTELRRRTGHDFSSYKQGTMLRRIERRLRLRELSGVAEYARYLKDDQHEPQLLMKDLLISVTNFFRDPDAVNILARIVIPKILQRKTWDNDVRVWVAGCATGEEAYTIAMLLSEGLAGLRSAPRVQVFATDLDAEAIAVAREGYYSEPEVADVSADRLQHFFLRDGDGYRVKRELRETILFAEHNVIKDPPFSHLDLISCRNLLIYLNRSAQSRVLEVMHFALNPQGYIFLGSSESVEGAGDFFTVVDKDAHIFQRRAISARTIVPVPDTTFQPPLLATIEKQKSPEEIRAIDRLSYIDIHQRMLEEFAPPSLIVNEEYEIVHMSDRVGRYLRFAGGEPSHNLLKVILPELRMELRTMLYQAMQNRTKVAARGLVVNTKEGIERVSVLVRPVLREGDPARGFILILFDRIDSSQEESGPHEVLTQGEPVSRQLEEELMHSKSQLRTTVEQYEVQQEELRASNEELQAMNEELRSSAEELETSQEELQSVNEELTTVNQELKIKIEELRLANNDFTNLINSTEIGTIFLDRGLNVKMFTPRARDAFNLIDSDLGRPLFDISCNLAYDELRQDIDYVFRSLRVFDKEVQSLSGNWYVMRIVPYRTTEDQISGVVVTFVDITENKRVKSELGLANEDLEREVLARTSKLEEANKSLWIEVGERRQSEASRLRLLSQLVTVQELERQRVARDLHDHLGQQLTALRLKLESFKRDANSATVERQLGELLGITGQLDADIEGLVWQLRPMALDDLGFPEALRHYTSRWGQHYHIAVQFHSRGFEDGRPSAEIENNLYRIAQEALNNVAKHASASRVDVIFERRDRHAVLIIEDNGVGFELPKQARETEGLGLSSMRERAALMGGSVEIETTPGEGTSVFVRIPLKFVEGRDAKVAHNDR